jgi:nitrite reductase (NADH) large subunit
MKNKRRNDSSHYVIVGNSVAGLAAVEAIREIDRERPITIIDRERRDSYSRPLISYYLEERVDDNLMRLRPRDFYRRMSARTILGEEVRAIDARQGHVVLARNRRIAYRKLLLAVGAEAVRPAISGIEGPGIYTFTSMDDALALRKNVRQRARAVVIGAGLIGIKAAEALQSLGARVTIVEMADRPLPAVLDREGGRIVAAHIRKSGVGMILLRRVREIRRRGSTIISVALDNGEEIPCAHLVIAAGVRPRLELCRGTGMRTKTGIFVDRFMATSVKGIYAAGDVTEAASIAGGKMNIPVWPLAYQQGRVAGANMAGEKKTYRPGTQMNSIEVFGLPLITFGESAADEGKREILAAREKSGAVYRKIVLKKNRIAGAIFLGEIERAGIIAGLMFDGADIESFKQDLLGEKFGYIYVPIQNRAKYIAPIEV